MKNNPLFTIIIPTLDEEKVINDCLKSIIVPRSYSAEILVIDGGSVDKTINLAKNVVIGSKIKVIESERAGLARQFDLGVKNSTGRYLIFLHADCRLPDNALVSIKDFYKKYGQRGVGGAFKMRVKGNRFFYRISSLGGNMYCNITKTFFGDRAMFISRYYYEMIGGFKDIPIMSDFEFSRRMKKAGIVKQLKGVVISDGRKFEKESFFRIIYLQVWVLLAFRRGVDPLHIKEKYYYSQKNN
jgi:rSAM/selenodomain-associated transferase 2